MSYPRGDERFLVSHEPATNRCTHHLDADEDVNGDQVTACATKARGATFGVLADEGVLDSFVCAVLAANEAARLNCEYTTRGDPFFAWARLCTAHEKQPADGCEECAPDGAEEEPAGGDEDPGVSGRGFVSGERVVCADGVPRTVEGMAPSISGEPARLIVVGGAQWIAANCLRANGEDVVAAQEPAQRAARRVHPDAHSLQPIVPEGDNHWWRGRSAPATAPAPGTAW
ncbi:hypothetical protein ABZ851_29880 [Streptomyces sp. NPDC047049]|uniref:hypothetical protein n=1 Tax=Streptomyces sp. NPDC047049 TaxID=3156688 RepID=UPI003403B3F3